MGGGGSIRPLTPTVEEEAEKHSTMSEMVSAKKAQENALSWVEKNKKRQKQREQLGVVAPEEAQLAGALESIKTQQKKTRLAVTEA